MSINEEKQRIINTGGNILVTANPGTGKTLLLAHKYFSLVSDGIPQDKILCLTFTEKAKSEMEERIISMNEERNAGLDISRINVFTFHSFAMNNLDSRDIISSNLLRFAIYLYVKDKKYFNYSNSYILDKIVPKIENTIRYLKSFGIKPIDIDHRESCKYLKEEKNLASSEMELFLKIFIGIYEYYESMKEQGGYDYADLLIEYLKLKNKPFYDFVLVDELQDVNKMEADIALMSARNYIAVGDKKQAIFGFQGGSISNFDSFMNSTGFILNDNFRSTNQILYYAKEYVSSKTKDELIVKELQDLSNADNKTGDPVSIVEVEKNTMLKAVQKLLSSLSNLEGKTAVILRTNEQITQLSNELDSNGIHFSSTHLGGSDEAKRDIILFLKGFFSDDVRTVKNSMFSSFSPVKLRKAFELSRIKHSSIEELMKDVGSFSKLRDSITNTIDIKKLFKDHIIPVSATYGKEYFISAKKLMDAFFESLSILDEITYSNIVDYLESTELDADEIEDESALVLTTVHKSKGREYDNVIYLPTQPRNTTDFVDNAVKAILNSKGIDVDEEFEEETLRVNFVAFTRARNKLFILTEKPTDYLNEYSQLASIENMPHDKKISLNESEKKAFTFFVNKDFEQARKIIETRDKWLIDFICKHFENLDSLSFTSLNTKPFDYLKNNILDLREYSDELSIGSEVHRATEKLLKGEQVEISAEALPFVENARLLVQKIKNEYPEIALIEENFRVNLDSISNKGFDIMFSGKIDAVFSNESSYLMVDWKTSRNKNEVSTYRRQLECYKRALCECRNLDYESVEVCTAFLGLRSSVNTNKFDFELDNTQPGKNVFNTFLKHVGTIMAWKEDPELFFKELYDEKKNIRENLWRALIEQYLKEKTARAESVI